jgi:RNA polymerase sigma factor (sigma-70 family)
VRASIRVAHAVDVLALPHEERGRGRDGDGENVRRFWDKIAVSGLAPSCDGAVFARGISSGVGMASSSSNATDEGRDVLVQENLRLVALIGRQFANRGVETTDLFQEGSIGLIKASRRFDESRGVRFTTYAAWWIRQGMGRAIAEQGRTIRLPSHVRGALREVAQTAHDLVQRLGRAPAPAEIAARLSSTPARIEKLLDLRGLPVSLDSPAARPSDELPLIDRLSDEEAGRSPEELLEARLLTAAIRGALAKLRAREREVLSLRFGIDGEPCNLQQVAARLELHVHRVRQIEQRALKRLKHDPLLAGLIQR